MAGTNAHADVLYACCFSKNCYPLGEDETTVNGSPCINASAEKSADVLLSEGN